MPPPPLLQRLGERKLVQWGLAYLAGAFVVFQGVEVMAGPWGLSPAFQRAVHVGLLMGLFVTLVLAWYHGEKGRQRVSGPELLMVAALLVVAGAALTWVGGLSEDPSARPRPSEGDEPRVAVLPCANMSPRPEDAFRAEGLHQEIISRLQGISSLLTIGRTSVLRFADDPPPVPEIAGILPADFVGECSVLKDPDESWIRITFRLLDAGGIQVWDDSYDRDLTLDNFFDILNDISERVAAGVGAVLTLTDQERLADRPTEILEAWDAYQQGRALNSRPGTDNARRAIGLLKEAIRLDPKFAEAWVQLGTAYRTLGLYTTTLDPAPLADSSQLAVERGIQLDEQNAEAYATLSHFLLVWRWDLDGAEQAMQRALSLDSSLPEVRLRNAVFLLYTGRSGEALPEMRKALEQDPLGVIPNGWLAITLADLGRYAEAKTQNEKALNFDPSNAVVQGNLGWNYLRLNMPDSAAAVFRRVEAEDNPGAVAGLIHALVQLGYREEAVRVYDDLRSMADQEGVSEAQLAEAALPLDEDQAFDLLGQAVEERDRRLLDVLMFGKDIWDPSLRREILNRMGLDLEGDRLVVYGGGS